MEFTIVTVDGYATIVGVVRLLDEELIMKRIENQKLKNKMINIKKKGNQAMGLLGSLS